VPNLPVDMSSWGR